MATRPNALPRLVTAMLAVVLLSLGLVGLLLEVGEVAAA